MSFMKQKLGNYVTKTRKRVMKTRPLCKGALCKVT